MRITDLIDKRSICLDGTPRTKAEALDQMVALMTASGKIADEEGYRKQVYFREEESTTGIGVMIGLSVPKEKRKIPFLGALLVFLVTYFPLMGKFIRVIKVERKKQTA